MKLTIGRTIFPVAIAALALSACGSPDAADEQSGAAAGDGMPMASPRVWFAAPADGDSVAGPSLRVQMAVEGVRLMPADNQRMEGEGHLHIFLDTDPSADDMAIPQGSGIVHLGTGATEHTFENVPAGEHRLILVFAYGDHVPSTGVARDTIKVVVR